MTSRNNKPIRQALATVQEAVADALSRDGVAILPPADVHDTLKLAKLLRAPFSTTHLDPWYNKGVGGVRDDYIPYILGILERATEVSQHIYLWGFPEIIAPFVERIPKPLALVSWLTWYFKNNPSVIRGWRSAQMTCLHLSHPGAKLYVEHFLNQAQMDKWAEGTLRYIPGPPSVIEDSLLVGFVGRNEQTGHPSQKPVRVIQRILMMTTKEGDLVLDPMSGSGTTAEAARTMGRGAVICDHSEEYTQIAEKRLGTQRLETSEEIKAILAAEATVDLPEWPGVERVAGYRARPVFPTPTVPNQMAFLETCEAGDNGSGKAPKAVLKKPRTRARG
jgi:site-specific DNA-methyltransferase (adenine-specific)